MEAAAFQALNFRLNDAKTRVFVSVEEFEQTSLSREHHIAADLFMTALRGTTFAPQQERLEELADRASTEPG